VYKVKDVTNFTNAFKKLLKTYKPEGFLEMGRVIHGSNGKNVWVFKTNANLSQAFKFGPRNDLEKAAFDIFYKEISEETLSWTFTRKLISQFRETK
jgi:hypothetical protein